MTSEKDLGKKALDALEAITYMDSDGNLRMGHAGDAKLGSRIPEDVKKYLRSHSE